MFFQNPERHEIMAFLEGQEHCEGAILIRIHSSKIN